MGRDNEPGLQRATWKLKPSLFAKCVEYTLNFKPTDVSEERDKKILEYFFLNGYTATYIHDLHDPCIVCYSNRAKGKPLSASSILNIAYKHLPELKQRERCYIPSGENKRKELERAKRQGIKKRKACAFCGATTELELHHMIPISMGGGNEPQNLVYLCHKCHREATNYQNTIRNKNEI